MGWAPYPCLGPSGAAVAVAPAAIHQQQLVQEVTDHLNRPVCAGMGGDGRRIIITGKWGDWGFRVLAGQVFHLIR